jgi:hypothetical protein
MQKTIHQRLIVSSVGGVLLAAVLTGCLAEPTIAPVPTATSVTLVTATPPPPTPMPPTPAPTEAPREFVSYSHPSGVFTVAIPSDWEVRDSSRDDRLLVVFEPPMGYASQVSIDIVNEGPLTPDEMRAMADSYLRLSFADDSRYTEVSRADLPDGRLQVTFLYSDGHGATGRETIYLQQTGAYFSALHVFLSDKDVLHLTSALTTMTDSFTIDPLAVWGGALAIIVPDDLRFFRVYSWTDSGSNTYVMGEVYNASMTDASYVTVDATLCDANGVVFETASNVVEMDVLERGGFAPFVVLFQGAPEGAAPCDTQARAEPADHVPYTALALTQTGTFDDFGRLTVSGTVTNNGLEIVGQVEIMIAAYDAEDNVIGYGAANLGDMQLVPGESAPFEYVFEELGGQAVNLGLWVQAETVEAEG